SHGGTTSLAEGITLCSHHHHRVHAEHIRITPLADGFDFHHRHGQPLGTTTRDTLGPLTPDPTAARDALTALDTAITDRGLLGTGADRRAAQETDAHGTSETRTADRRAQETGADGTHETGTAGRGPDEAGASGRRVPGVSPPATDVHGGALPAASEPSGAPPGRPADVKITRPPPPAKLTPATATREPLPSYPATYATAPATLWDPDPPF